MREKSRRKETGRRRVEEGEFCRNCNRLKHDQELHALRDKLELCEDALRMVLARADTAVAAIIAFELAASKALDE